MRVFIHPPDRFFDGLDDPQRKLAETMLSAYQARGRLPVRLQRLVRAGGRVVIGFAERMVVLVAPLARRWLVVLPVWKRSPAARSSCARGPGDDRETDAPPDLLGRARVMRSGDDGGEIVLLRSRVFFFSCFAGKVDLMQKYKFQFSRQYALSVDPCPIRLPTCKIS